MVAPDLVGCLFYKRESSNKLLSGVIVETEAYSQEEEACHGYKNRTRKNETLFGEPGRLYVYLTYGMYFCTNIVTEKSNWANGVLLRAIAIQGENERIAAGPGLISKRFGLNQTHDNMQISIENGIWITKEKFTENMGNIVQTTRIGISKAKDLPWRWYLQNSRSISKRVKGDRLPSHMDCWVPNYIEEK